MLTNFNSNFLKRRICQNLSAQIHLKRTLKRHLYKWRLTTHINKRDGLSSHYIPPFVGRTSVLTIIATPVHGPEQASYTIIAHQQSKATFWFHPQRWSSKPSISYHQSMGPTTLNFGDTMATFLGSTQTHTLDSCFCSVCFPPPFGKRNPLFFWSSFPSQEGRYLAFKDIARQPHTGGLAWEWRAETEEKGEYRKGRRWAGKKETNTILTMSLEAMDAAKCIL